VIRNPVKLKGEEALKLSASPGMFKRPFALEI
jgi:hypothetical protein